MIREVTVDLGVRKIKIPVCEIKGKKEGPVLLVTAGADGDEVSGMEAAYKLADEYKNGDFAGQLNIIPILNIPGLENSVSINPIDNTYPKRVYPGRTDGSATERLIYWLNENYILKSKVWLDLHGGALDEMLSPFAYTYHTGKKDLDTLTNKIIKTLDFLRLTHENSCVWGKVELLAENGVCYVIIESGFGGIRNDVWVVYHLKAVRAVMMVLGMTVGDIRQSVKPRIYGKIISYRSKCNGLWYPHLFPDSLVVKGELIGKLKSVNNRDKEIINSDYFGEVLWMRKNIYTKKGTTVAEIATNPLKSDF